MPDFTLDVLGLEITFGTPDGVLDVVPGFSLRFSEVESGIPGWTTVELGNQEA